MADRHFPVRPDLESLKQQAQDLLRAIHRGDPPAVAELRRHHPKPILPAAAGLADARLALARAYGLPSWARLVLACRMTAALWCDDAGAVRDLVQRHPRLLHEDARGVRGHWGPPMSYAANLGHEDIITMLHGLGATDVQQAFERACLQGRIAAARQLHSLGGRPIPGSVMGPCETHCAAGLALLFELGAELVDRQGDRRAPVAAILETANRNPAGKHACLDLIAPGREGALSDPAGRRRGWVVDLPATPPMAVHRGRIDLLAAHLRRDPLLFSRTFSLAEIYPPELGCHADPTLALHGTPLDGATLLHLCVDADEVEIARWMIEHGADVNARAAVDADGFGGHTALFGCVVSQPYRVHCRQDDLFARLLLDHGADPNARASLRKRLRFVADETLHEYRDLTPVAWGERFHDQDWVSTPALRLIAERGGHA
jgi:hypothetical protein